MSMYNIRFEVTKLVIHTIPKIFLIFIYYIRTMWINNINKYFF